MKQSPRVIKTQADYEAALARLSTLMDEKITPGSPKDAELELWSVVIEHYERQHVERPIADPIEAILFRMEQDGLEKKDMVPYFGSLPKVSEVLSRKRPLSLNMMRKLHKGLGIPADVLLCGSGQDEADLTDDLAVDYTRFPLLEMKERGYFPSFKGTARELKEQAEEQVRSYFRGFTFGEAFAARLRAPLHQNGHRPMDEHALWAWQVAVLKKAHTIKVPTAYKPGSITQDWLRELARLSRFGEGPRLAVEFLADRGVKLVVEPHFKKTYLDGAALLDDSVPVVALTLRHDRIDNFWFALLHELVHVQKHLTPNRPFIVDDLDDKQRSSREEREADEGAQNALIPPADWAAAHLVANPSVEGVNALAAKLRIHPAIVAGRVRKETGNWRLMNRGNVGVKQWFGSVD